ncbi:hypothetical protein ACC745_37950, partial [Rhizobium ruizarguesonis]
MNKFNLSRSDSGRRAIYHPYLAGPDFMADGGERQHDRLLPFSDKKRRRSDHGAKAEDVRRL